MAINAVKNFMLLGHTQSGKTSVCDALSFKLGLNDRLGSVSAETSISDFTDEEKKRKISIYAKAFCGETTPASGPATKIVFIDTPGYDDFVGQVLCAFRASDAALITVDADSGIQVGTLAAWKRCSAMELPRGVVVTGLDKENANFTRALENIRSLWGSICIPVVFFSQENRQVLDIIGEGSLTGPGEDQIEKYRGELIEVAAESEEALIEKYLGGESLTEEEFIRGLRTAICAGKFIPVFATIPIQEVGINELLNGISLLFPSPSDIERKDINGTTIKTDRDAPFVGIVWKTVTDAYAGKLAMVRVLGGTMKEGMEALNSVRGHKERIGSLLLMTGNKKPETISEAIAGDIVAVPKLKSTGINDILCDPGHKVELISAAIPAPVVSFAAVAKERGDEDKIGIALSRVAEDDPTLIVERRADTHEIVISGMGDVHIDVAQELMKKRSNVDVTFRTPKVPYRETVTKVAEGHHKHKKQSGGRGQYGEVYLRVAPKNPEEEWFEDAVVGGVIPKNFIPACEKGLVEAMTTGATAGFPVVNVKVTIFDGSYHDVDSSEIAFKIAAARAFREAMSKAGAVLLEPIMNVKVIVSDHYMGDVSGDLNQKRGRIQGVEVEDGMQVITAEVPQSEMFRYSSELRSMTGGRGAFKISFAKYDVVPNMITQKIVAAISKDDDADQE